MKQHIIKQFLKEGILLSPESLDAIDESNSEQLLSQAKSSKQLVFSTTPESPSPTHKQAIHVRKIEEKESMTAQDFAAFYNSRFEGIKGILAKKLEGPISVSNAKKSASDVVTIGMVRESTQRGFIIEDTTGWVEVISKAEDVVEDDVIGVKGVAKEGKVFAQETIWPDIPLSYNHNPVDTPIFLSVKKEKGATVTPGSTHFSGESVSFSNPGWVTISSGKGSTTVLVYRPEKAVSPKEALSWLKKRHIQHSKTTIRWTEDPLIIEPIPNILWIVAEERWKEIYKGVVVVSSRGDPAVSIDLQEGLVGM